MSDSLSFERIADRYDETRGGEDRGRQVAAELAPVLRGAAPVLEVGIGTGLVAAGLRELGLPVVGVDISPAMAARARGRIGSRVTVGDALRLPVRSGAIDRAYSVWVLHVVGDRPATLAEVARVLRPGGRYAVVPAWMWPEDEVGRVLEPLWTSSIPERRDDPATLEAEAPEAGLRVREVRDLPPRVTRESPTEAVRNIEARTYSMLWDLSEDRWREIVVPVIDELRAMPEPDRPRDRVRTDRVVVLERV